MVRRVSKPGAGAAGRAFLLGSAPALVVVALAIGAAGCGPMQYLANVPFGAAPALAEAQHVDAEKYAPYEVTASREYLRRARELGGYARFHSSVIFARRSEQLATDARRIVEKRAAVNDAPSPPASAAKTP